ncbi:MULTISPECIES: phosphotransferase RcsD [Rahnella]|jgi:two-component system sensor histidine kinase RcsD|uniref:Phosphotransferase RcsD n=1 Tax=Rahnella sp. (strain Y9602) TaxID=2703885 RepID=A0A0H3FD19_RAHSY|nr:MULTISPECIES: phosphotransferase RcsD [Rahnella]AFE57490.1 phosphotransfer intermediate protein in two-component regulatory system with RcsBC [Rahnella aquatilis HX2]AYA06248.1 phosphotransferase RcsD [Rahnella aquatilis]ADW72917.1 multi-sensor signal transduction histidine kinase [Rahnella aceris]AZP41480.1 phosphotransferase RcsD [Rahnella aquatilis]AZP45821.1 phosphotransferase RcsD [Rahnella aquatilis]
MAGKYLSLTSTNITRFFWLFILLLAMGLGLYGYNYTNAYLNDKLRTVQNTADLLQKRIDKYRYMTYQIYDNFTGQPMAADAVSAQEIRLRQDMYFVSKPHKKTDALIFGAHDSSTLDLTLKISSFLDDQWGSTTHPYSLYYLNGQDNSMLLITTVPLQLQDSRLKENYFTSTLQSRRAEMLQQANTLDERESYSPLRKSRQSNDYSFSLRTTFNNPGHLATVIAFDLPMSDLIPYSMSRDNFQLNGNTTAVNEGDPADDNPAASSIVMQGWSLVFDVPLRNSPLSLTYHVPLFSLVVDLSRNNFWLILINLFLIGLAMTSIYFIRHQYIRPSENMAAQLQMQQALNQEIISGLPLGLLVYNFSNHSVILSNKIADQLLPHLSLNKIANMAEQHHGTIQATVNNEVYEIRMIRSQISPETYLFMLHDQDKEVMVNRTLQQAKREFEKNLQARKLMLHNLGIELNQPLQELNGLAVALVEEQKPEERQALESKLLSESRNALTLVDNITLLTRLETQDWQPANDKYVLSTLVDELLLEALPRLNQKGLGLLNHFQIAPEAAFVGDMQAVKKILSLLLDYAIVTTSLGKVTLTSEQDEDRPDQLIFHINDTGSGISKEELSNLNYPFLSQTLVDRFNHGSGLTFFLCNQLCKKLGGQLEIRSKLNIGTRYTVRVKQRQEAQEIEAEDEKLLNDVTVLLDITSEEVRGIVTRTMNAYGAVCIVADDRQVAREYDVLLTDNPQNSDKFTLLLTDDESGFQQLEKHYIRVNYNISNALIDATLLLIEQQFSVSDDSVSPEEPGEDSLDLYEKQLKSSDYYQLFVETVPEDLEKLYNENQRRDFTSLSQTAHRLKGVFAMLNLTPGKQMCESLEQYIADGDALQITETINHIDSFVSRLLQQGS